jgi:hypothetical protein
MTLSLDPLRVNLSTRSLNFEAKNKLILRRFDSPIENKFSVAHTISERENMST